MPWPPSINGYWRSFNNRQIISKRGREYRVSVLNKCKELGLYNELVGGDLSLTMVLNPPTLRKYDVDNFNKALFDGLTHAGFWVDDEQIQRLSISKGVKTAGGNVVVSVTVI